MKREILKWVRKYKRIQVMNTLRSYVFVFNNVINMRRVGKVIRKVKKYIKQEVEFWLNRIRDGIKEIIQFF